MTVIRKTGAHNRSTGAIAGKRMRKALGLPKNAGYCVAVPLHLLNSPAWLVMSPQCRRFVDALMAEFATHGGAENGNLIAPYDQLQARGIRREVMLDIVFEAQALGIVDAARGQRSYGSRRAPSVYRLTWLGTPDGLSPTNEWRAIKTAEEAETRLINARYALARERALRKATRAEHRVKTSLKDVGTALAITDPGDASRVA
jgi:hypothetical protein